MDLGPRSRRDQEIWPHLEPIEGRISAEQVLSGRGLSNLYKAGCRADGWAPLSSHPADVTARAAGLDDPAAEEVVRLFSTYLGRVAGEAALTYVARGGVFLAGESAKKSSVLRDHDFREAFEDKAPHSSLLRSVPVFVVTHPTVTLAGLAA